MKDFFEDLGKRLSETAEAVTAKAGDAIEIQKLKAQIRELARGNAEDLMELGQSIYDRFENGEELEFRRVLFRSYTVWQDGCERYGFLPILRITCSRGRRYF